MTEFNRTDADRRGMPDNAIAVAMREAEAWTRAQGELFCAIEAVWAEWIERQRQAFDASARSLQRVCECRTIADLVQIQQEWLADAVKRSVSDAEILAGGTAAVMRRLAAIDAPPSGASGRAPAKSGKAPAGSGETAPPQRAAAE